ncbi:MAG: hypothetical protein LC118_13200, partial [Dehalococcoidia bacterium]|nr:hypothetical protein [Dehalococcoidia bacterium]
MTAPATSSDARRDDARKAIREAVSALVNERASGAGSVPLEVPPIQRKRPAHAAPTRYPCRGLQGLAAQLQPLRQKGEQAIRILAPIVVKRVDPATGVESRAVVGFRGACVFDVSQTSGDPLPEPPTCVPHDGSELAGHLPALEGHARELGYIVLRYVPEGGALGYCDPIGKRIVLSPELS